MTTNERPIFIVGLPRSGTTLLRSLVTAHPKIAIAPETQYLNMLVPAMGGEELTDRRRFEDFWAFLTRHERFENLEVDADRIKGRILESEDYSYRNIFKSLLITYAGNRDKEIWGEKTPAHYRHVDRLLDWFPSARVLYIVRDPRAICNSLRSVYWRKWNQRGFKRLEPRTLMHARRIYHDATLWKNQSVVFRKQWQSDGRILLIRFEDLLADTEACLGEVFSFLGVEYQDVVEKREFDEISIVSEASESRRDAWRADHFKKAVSPISLEPIHKWRSSLREDEIRLVEKICHEEMQYLGYDDFVTDEGNAIYRVSHAIRYLWGMCYFEMGRERHRSLNGHTPSPRGLWTSP